ncbi:MAG: type I DNA topoisomerase [Albidovulum sp.]|nr:type I DNA topoisomerase [Albidovulum sp.]
MPVVVVESPAKAKTIEKYLGKDYSVHATFGHIRDLPSKSGSVDPENGFALKWELQNKSQKHVTEIARALGNDSRLILATDPDREGEAISWHLCEILKQRKLITGKGVERVVFNAITKSAILAAMESPRELDLELVQAYLARRVLDYLVGFNLSPVLWRKLPGANSAGRVQSVALRLIVEREFEIIAFRQQEYWTVKADLAKEGGEKFSAALTVLDGRRLQRLDLETKEKADRAVAEIEARDLKVVSLKSARKSQRPLPPFATATLQQDSGRKLGFGTRKTMSVAQKLYESGHITYMRTDGIEMAPEAIAQLRKSIGNRYGAEYVPKSANRFKNKAKNAQEAHECIRPTDFEKSSVSLGLDDDQRRLYDLIWKRATASQMECAKFKQTTVDIGSGDDQVVLRANGRVTLFDGFLKIYEESRDHAESENAVQLPPLAEGEELRQLKVSAEQHFTKPPARYTEPSLVKRMVELGIGRPSTYATIVATIQDRGYVSRVKRNLVPQGIGIIVTIFLKKHFERYVEYEFTAGMEENLDDVSGGRKHWKAVLEEFWKEFSSVVSATSTLRVGEVLEEVTENLVPLLQSDRTEGDDPRTCPKCGRGKLVVRTSRSGSAFFGCSEYPACNYGKNLIEDSNGSGSESRDSRELGHDSDGLPIQVRHGRFGPYVQLGPSDDGKVKPRICSIPRGMDPIAVDLEIANSLLALPRTIGPHPEDGQNVLVGIGRYGPYLKHGRNSVSISDASETFTIGMNRAVELLAAKNSTGRTGGGLVKELGDHPKLGGQIRVFKGRYGPYVKWNKINASLPKSIQPDQVDIDQAVELIDRRNSNPKRAASTRKRKSQ